MVVLAIVPKSDPGDGLGLMGIITINISVFDDFVGWRL
jgi:hypothetical protein